MPFATLTGSVDFKPRFDSGGSSHLGEPPAQRRATPVFIAAVLLRRAFRRCFATSFLNPKASVPTQREPVTSPEGVSPRQGDRSFVGCQASFSATLIALKKSGYL